MRSKYRNAHASDYASKVDLIKEKQYPKKENLGWPYNILRCRE